MVGLLIVLVLPPPPPIGSNFLFCFSPEPVTRRCRLTLRIVPKTSAVDGLCVQFTSYCQAVSKLRLAQGCVDLFFCFTYLSTTML